MSAKLRLAPYALLAGVLAGASSSLFLHLLQWATYTRETHPLLIWALPVAGLFIGWVYHGYGREAVPGNSLIIDAIHDPKKTVPLRMAPLILGSTVSTHLFGGSAGREGTAVQMGGSLAEQIALRLGLSGEDRRRLLIAGAGAGFGAALGTPWAGAIFGVEMLHKKRFDLRGIFESAIASFAGYYTSLMLAAPHSHFEIASIPAADLNGILFVALAGMAFGIAARLFIMATHAVEWLQGRIVRRPMWKPFVGGLLILLMWQLEGTTRYLGLGIGVIQQSLQSTASFYEPIIKILFTTVTLGSGFKGGEFIPLVFIGATLGSALSLLIPVPYYLLGAVGMAAVFGAAANTPLACAVMAIEIFGPEIAPYALAACYMAFVVSGELGIYKSQK